MTSQAASHLNMVQLNGLIKIAGIDGTREILDAFWSSTRHLIDLMRVHVQNDDFEGAASTAHAIKGSAANIGALCLHEKVQMFETFCRTQRLMHAHDVELIAEVFEQTQREFHEQFGRAGD